MKVLLLIVVIHVLVFHQYMKDKNEMLAPGGSKKSERQKSSYDDNYLSRRVSNNITDTIPEADPPKSYGYYFGSYSY